MNSIHATDRRFPFLGLFSVLATPLSGLFGVAATVTAEMLVVNRVGSSLSEAIPRTTVVVKAVMVLLVATGIGSDVGAVVRGRRPRRRIAPTQLALRARLLDTKVRAANYWRSPVEPGFPGWFFLAPDVVHLPFVPCEQRLPPSNSPFIWCCSSRVPAA